MIFCSKYKSIGWVNEYWLKLQGQVLIKFLHTNSSESASQTLQCVTLPFFINVQLSQVYQHFLHDSSPRKVYHEHLGGNPEVQVDKNYAHRSGSHLLTSVLLTPSSSYLHPPKTHRQSAWACVLNILVCFCHCSISWALITLHVRGPKSYRNTLNSFIHIG